MFGLAFIFAAAAIPFVFLAIDTVARASLKMSLDDLGPDTMLISVSLCLARIIEAIEMLVRTPLDSTGKDVNGAIAIAFAILFLISFAIWIACLGIIQRKVGEKWRFIGGNDLPPILSVALGLFSSVIFTTIYAISRVLI